MKLKKKMKKTLHEGEIKALFLMSLTDSDLYPDKTKSVKIEIEDKNGKKVFRDLTIEGLIGFIGLAFHILEHEYSDTLKN